MRPNNGEAFAVKYPRMVEELEECFAEWQRLQALITENLRGISSAE